MLRTWTANPNTHRNFSVVQHCEISDRLRYLHSTNGPVCIVTMLPMYSARRLWHWNSQAREICAVPGLDCAVRKWESSEIPVLCTACSYIAVSFCLFFICVIFHFSFFIGDTERWNESFLLFFFSWKNKIRKNNNSEQLCSVVFRSAAFSRSAGTTNRFEAATFKLWYSANRSMCFIFSLSFACYQA